jgi:hypothetical protein
MRLLDNTAGTCLQAEKCDMGKEKVNIEGFHMTDLMTLEAPFRPSRLAGCRAITSGGGFRCIALVFWEHRTMVGLDIMHRGIQDSWLCIQSPYYFT